MPHLILEYSNNIDLQSALTVLFEKIHQLLAKELPTRLSSCKSRCIIHNLFYIGGGSKENAFAHLTIKVLPGRTEEKKCYIGQSVLQLLNACFQKYNRTLN